MKAPTILLLSVLVPFACSTPGNNSKELLDHIFSSNYEHSIISKGDNLPNFDRRKDSLDLFLISMHENVDPADFQLRVGWSDQERKEKIQFLIDRGWLVEDEKGLRPSVFIVSDVQGKELFRLGKELAQKIAASIEEEVPSIQAKVEAADLPESHTYESMAFLILSNVLLDNWQIMEMEAAYLKKENRPERHGKFYYASIMENVNTDFESFGIYGNQYGRVNDSTFLSIYGNNRDVVNKRLRSDQNYCDSILQVAIVTTPEHYMLFEDLAEDYRPKLLQILEEETEFSHRVYEKTGYAEEITYEEFFIWWYHFIYSEATNMLAQKNLLTIPRDGNYYYR
jgi:hypothetical protein